MNQRAMHAARSRWQREKYRHTARVNHGPGAFVDANDGDASEHRSPRQGMSSIALLFQRPMGFPLVLAGALFDLLGLAVLPAYVVLTLFGVFASAGLGRALPAFPGDQTASLRVVLMPISAALVEWLKPLRAFLEGTG